MKKIISIILALCTLFSLVSLVACSGGEPVAFTKKLTKGRNCYADVVEVIPATNITSYYYLFCECVLENGNSILMKIDPEDYVEYFDPEASSYDIRCTARAAKYDEPVRLTGKVGRESIATNVLSYKEKSTTFFSFVEADKTETLASSEKRDVSIPYQTGMKWGIHIYADIMSISPEYKVTNTSLYFINVVCKCITANNEELWVIISEKDYKKYFDGSASFDNLPDIFSQGGTDTLEFATPARISGLTVKTKDEFDYPEGKFSDVIFKFKGADKEQVEASKLYNQDEIAYTGNEKKDTPVYIDIMSITPEYTVSSVTNIWLKDYVCSCMTTDGRKVWIILSNVAFDTYFLNEDNTVKTFPRGVRVNGRICIADEQASGLAESIGKQTLIAFKNVEE